MLTHKNLAGKTQIYYASIAQVVVIYPVNTMRIHGFSQGELGLRVAESVAAQSLKFLSLTQPA